jgi:hypothetical protein
MSNAAFTRFFNNKGMLRNWLNYYSKYFDKLFVFGCELSDPTRYNLPDHERPAYDNVSDLIKEYNVEYLDTGLPIYSSQMYQTIFDKQKELLKEHEWVLYTDMDEIVVADQDRYKDIKDFMNRSEVKQSFCEGYNVFMGEDEDTIDWNKPIMEQRHLWGKDVNGSYSKPALSRIPTDWVEGFHYVRWMPENEVKDIENTGLYLFHLKHINEKDGPPESLPIVEIPKKFRRAF